MGAVDRVGQVADDPVGRARCDGRQRLGGVDVEHVMLDHDRVREPARL